MAAISQCCYNVQLPCHCCACLQAVRVPGGVVALASVANEIIVQSGCATLQPLIRQLYPSAYATPESLGLSAADVQDVPAMDPRLAGCALRGV